jgi:hypothetical protein
LPESSPAGLLPASVGGLRRLPFIVHDQRLCLCRAIL